MTTVTMRLVDGHGPLVAMRWAIEVESAHHVSALWQGTTDDDGRVMMPGNSISGTAHVQVWPGSEVQPALEGIAVVTYGSTPPPVLDLGDVRMIEAPLLVSGIVCTSDGKGVAGAAVSIEGYEEVACWHGPPTETGQAYGRFGVVNRFSATSDSWGRFTILGSSSFSHLSVRAAAFGYVELFPTEPFLRKGDTSVRVVIAPRASMPKNAIPFEPPPPPPRAK